MTATTTAAPATRKGPTTLGRLGHWAMNNGAAAQEHVQSFLMRMQAIWAKDATAYNINAWFTEYADTDANLVPAHIVAIPVTRAPPTPACSSNLYL